MGAQTGAAAHATGLAYAARRSQWWWSPPTSGIAMIGPADGGETGRRSGASLSSPRCVLWSANIPSDLKLAQRAGSGPGRRW